MVYFTEKWQAAQVASKLSELYGRPGSRVAVIGIGGLGHLAIQFASRMGCEVTAVSGHPDKEAEARSYGASRFMSGKPAPRSFDLVLNTSVGETDMGVWLGALRPEVIFSQLGAGVVPAVPASLLILGYRSVTGSGVAHPAVLREMLDFAARHGVKAKVEVMPMARCNEAMANTRSGAARYRMVLER